MSISMTHRNWYDWAEISFMECVNCNLNVINSIVNYSLGNKQQSLLHENDIKDFKRQAIYSF